MLNLRCWSMLIRQSGTGYGVHGVTYLGESHHLRLVNLLVSGVDNAERFRPLLLGSTDG